MEGRGLGLGFEVCGVGCVLWGEKCWVLGVGCGVWGVGCGVWGVGCVVRGVGCGVGVWSSGFEFSETLRRFENDVYMEAAYRFGT